VAHGRLTAQRDCNTGLGLGSMMIARRRHNLISALAGRKHADSRISPEKTEIFYRS
jgi:hypothetical protein